MNNVHDSGGAGPVSEPFLRIGCLFYSRAVPKEPRGNNLNGYDYDDTVEKDVPRMHTFTLFTRGSEALAERVDRHWGRQENGHLLRPRLTVRRTLLAVSRFCQGRGFFAPSRGNPFWHRCQFR